MDAEYDPANLKKVVWSDEAVHGNNYYEASWERKGTQKGSKAENQKDRRRAMARTREATGWGAWWLAGSQIDLRVVGSTASIFTCFGTENFDLHCLLVRKTWSENLDLCVLGLKTTSTCSCVEIEKP